MFSAIGNYIYDRRRGLLKSAGVVGTLYIAGKYVLQRLEEVKEAVLTERNAKENLRRRFQQNMQDCTYTIMAYMPTLAGRILEELDVERISLELQSRSKKPIIPAKQTSSVDDDSSRGGGGPSTHLSASLISAAELEASSPISAFSNLSENHATKSENGDAESAVPSSSGQAVSEGQNTSSFLSGLQSTEPLSSSLPLSSFSPGEHRDLMADSALSWLQMNAESSQRSGSGDADDEGQKATANVDTMPVIPDLDLPIVDLSAVSIIDTQSRQDTRPSDSFGSRDSAPSHTEEMPERQGPLQRMTKAELWHELKILSFTRVLVVLYATTLLSLQIHVQLNLIGRHKYVESVHEMEEQERLREKEQEMQEGMFDSMGLVESLMASVAPALSSSLGMGFSSIHSEEDAPTREFSENQLVDEDIERKYLTLSWWLLHIGWRDLASSVRTAVEDVLQGVSLKTRLSMSDLRALMLQMRKRIEFQADGETRTDITSAIFPLSTSAEQNVLIQGGISPHLATIDPPLRRLLDETKAYVASSDFQLVWGLALDKGCDMVLDGLEREVFGEVPNVQEVDPSAGSADRGERLAGILPGLARWCHPALYGLPNELVEALGNMREVAGLSAIIYSSYNEGTVLPLKAGDFSVNRVRYESSVILRRPPASVPREAPTPLVFAYAKGWYEEEAKEWCLIALNGMTGLRTCAVAFAEQGFTTLEVELDPVSKIKDPPKSLQEALDIYAKELKHKVTLFNIFPPVLVARGVGTFIGHTYVESFSVSGLVLVGPNGLVPAEVTLPDTWKSETSSDNPGTNSPTFAIPHFAYEPRFPIMYLEASDSRSPGEVEEMTNSHFSLWPAANIDFRVMLSSKGALYNEKDVVKELKSWLDEVGL